MYGRRPEAGQPRELAAFGEATLARQILTAIGGLGERTFTGIQRSAAVNPSMRAA